MNTSLIDTLNGLREDPILAIQLYKQLFEAEFYALVRSGTENDLDKMEFLIYDTKDEIKEIPLFTNEKFIPANLSHGSSIIKVSGQIFWTKIIEVIEIVKCQIAINPLQSHGIRLTKEMILGMIINYGGK